MRNQNVQIWSVDHKLNLNPKQTYMREGKVVHLIECPTCQGTGTAKFWNGVEHVCGNCKGTGERETA
jgi:DnaJ-class molecular chaperone